MLVLSVDTNLLLYSLNQDCREYDQARAFLIELASSRDVVICELVLVELYMLLRNPAVLKKPYGAKDAAETCRRFRANRRWRVVEAAPIMASVWKFAARPRVARRRIIDARIAFTLQHHGVTAFATRNTKDFLDLGFRRVWDPLVDAPAE